MSDQPVLPADCVPHDGPGAVLWREEQSTARTPDDVLAELRRRLRDDLGYSIGAYLNGDGDARVEGLDDAVDEIIDTLRDMGLLPALTDGLAAGGSMDE